MIHAESKHFGDDSSTAWKTIMFWFCKVYKWVDLKMEKTPATIWLFYYGTYGLSITRLKSSPKCTIRQWYLACWKITICSVILLPLKKLHSSWDFRGLSSHVWLLGTVVYSHGPELWGWYWRSTVYGWEVYGWLFPILHVVSAGFQIATLKHHETNGHT